jgi:hypothetical protein
MFVSKEELAVEIAQVDCVKVNDVNFAEAGQCKVLEEFTADTAGADK